MRFDYSPLPGLKSKVVLSPIVPVIFKYKKVEFPTFALVDSGAAGALISTVIADALGIKWEKLEVGVGFTASGQFRFHRVKTIEADIGENNFSLSLNIVEGISPFHCILGQNDLFKKAKIVFEGYNKQFEIIFRDYN